MMSARTGDCRFRWAVSPRTATSSAPTTGWCFDGVTGRCTAIPHLRDEERVTPNIRIAAFATAENVADLFRWSLRTPALAPRVGPPRGEEPDEGTTMFAAQVAHGLVLVWSGPGGQAAEPLPLVEEAEQAAAGPWRYVSGLIDVRAPHEHVVEAIAWNPGRALGLGWLLGAGEELCEADVQAVNGALVMQRERYTLGLPRASTFQPLYRGVTSSRIAVVPDTGLSTIVIDDGAVAFRPRHDRAHPGRGSRCTVRWRLQVRQRQLAAVGLARSTTTLQRLFRRAETPVEAVADEVADNAFDERIIRLREARAARSDRQT